MKVSMLVPTYKRPELLAFIYPQIGPGYTFRPFDHIRYLTTVDEIERLTGIDFLIEVPDDAEAAVEREQAHGIWPADVLDFVPPCRGDGN